MRALNLLLFLLIILLHKVSGGEKENNQPESDEEFIPTDNWQIVKKGQKIPRGLHVRVNLETGLTEAKLFKEEENANKKKSLIFIPKELEKEEQNRVELKETLKKIKSDEPINIKEIKKLKDEFRSYDQIKKELSELDISAKLDVEVLIDLMKTLKSEMAKKKIEMKRIITHMDDLDFLVHQIDNAIEFMKRNGFEDIIYKALNYTNVEVKKISLKLTSTLLQNNPKVQIHVLKTGGIPLLLKVIQLEKEVSVKNKALSALGSLLRRFPLAQKKFLENGGLTVISKLFEVDDIKLQVKLVTLINDLINEKKYAIQDVDNSYYDELIRQYNELPLEEKLVEYEWCDNVNELLRVLILADQNDHDSIEKCLLSMNSTATKCSSKYNRKLLINLKKRYESLALQDSEKKEEDNNSAYFTELMNLCGELIQYNSEIKTEL